MPPKEVLVNILIKTYVPGKGGAQIITLSSAKSGSTPQTNIALNDVISSIYKDVFDINMFPGSTTSSIKATKRKRVKTPRLPQIIIPRIPVTNILNPLPHGVVKVYDNDRLILNRNYIMIIPSELWEAATCHKEV